jgi:DNA-directed RNA polymerase I subunit RPA1
MGGLYDPSLGVSPNEREVICKTCGHYGIRCSGHPGHLELLVPTYNPMIIDVLMKMLKMSCFNCHHLRIKDKVKEDLQVKFILIKNGLISESKEFSEIDPEIERRKLKKL